MTQLKVSQQAQQYVQDHAELYLGYAQALHRSSVDVTRRIEFAILSANESFDKAVLVWDAMGRDKAGRIETVMHEHGMGLTKMKGAAIRYHRARPHIVPYPDEAGSYRWYRRRRIGAHPGLANSKLSFATSLIDPLGSDIVCLDTHMVRGITGTRPDSSWYKSLARYEQVEGAVRAVAGLSEVPLFAAQWALWDYYRGTEPNPHSHLIEGAQ
tara:strand:+ start:634 stop:1269 length:636 start_codon:yes stop_codon:yes gene_type:complete